MLKHWMICRFHAMQDSIAESSFRIYETIFNAYIDIIEKVTEK